MDDYEQAIIRLIAAAQATIVPLVRLGDFIGNEDGGANGLPAFDRCAILLELRAALADGAIDTAFKGATT